MNWSARRRRADRGKLDLRPRGVMGLTTCRGERPLRTLGFATTRGRRMAAFDPASHLQMLREISAQVAAGHRLDDVLTTVTSVLVERADFRSVAIWLYLRDDECEHCGE